MVVPGTIETDIFQRLYDRIELFRHSIGELEPILRDELADINRRVLDPNLSDVQHRPHVGCRGARERPGYGLLNG
jgi:hypothetical protein